MDADALRTASRRFYEAANAVLRGDAAPMLALWSADDDVSYATPGGEIVSGAAALRVYWERAAQANVETPGIITAGGEDAATRIVGTIAYTVTVERIIIHQGAAASHLHARATNVYRLEDGGWRLLHRHAEPPVEDDQGAHDTRDAGT